jgi:thioredoxin reductase
MASAQDARAVQMWQEMLRESKLDNVIMLLLGDAIAKGDLPYHPNWLTWDWYFPAKPTIDVGRESEANIEEINAGLNTGANVVSESGQGDIEEVIIQRGHEVGMMIDAAQDEAKQRGLPWEQVYALMIPPPRGRGQGGGMPAAASVAADKVASQNPDKEGASDEGVEIDGGNGNGSGKGVRRFRFNDDGSVTIFYREDQARGAAGTPEGGQFVPEGGGAAESGGAAEGGGAAARAGKTPEGQAATAKQTGVTKAKTDDEAIDAVYKPEDAARYKELKQQWSTVNNKLLTQIDTPDSPEAQEGVRQLHAIVKEMHGLHADPGRFKDVGLPGGPRDVIVIGAGPGGLGAAINAGTDGLDTAFIDMQPISGGQSKYSSRVENYPGFPIGISGEKLAKNMYDQATNKGAEAILERQATGLTYDPKTGMKTVTMSDGSKLVGRSVIIAGGVQFRKIGDFPGRDDKTIVYGDAKVLGTMAQGKSVVVVGGSNGAAQAALGVSRQADHVYVLSRSPIGSGMSDYQVEALKANPKITIIENDQIGAVDKDESGNSRLLHTAQGKLLPADAVGIFAGSAPQTDWLPKEASRVTAGKEKGKVRVNRNLQVIDADNKVSMPGVYAVGDVREGSIQRILASAAEGQVAERNIFQYFAKTLGVKKTSKSRDVSIERAKKGEVVSER